MEVDSSSGSWEALTADLVERIAAFLPQNEVSCNLRLLNKSAAEILRCWKVVWLSQLVPHHAFLHRWAGEGSMDDLTLKQRKHLLCLLARSGHTANLEAAVSVAGCPLTHEVFKAAATQGHVAVCIWLHAMDCAHNYRSITLSAAGGGHIALVRWVLKQAPDTDALVRLAEIGLVAAAGADHRALCEELLEAGARGVVASLAAPSAAKGGHVELTEWLLEQASRFQNADVNDLSLLLEAAYGFDLPVLQRLYHSRLGAGRRDDFSDHWGERVALQAVTSPTPDWRAKLEWLEAVGCRLGGQVMGWSGVFDCADVLQRVTFLRRRGLVDLGDLLRVAVARGSLQVVRHLRSEGLLVGEEGTHGGGGDLTVEAAGAGNVAVLGELLAAGWRIGPEAVRAAATHGHLHVLRWLLRGGEEPCSATDAAVVVDTATDAAAAAVREAMRGADLMRCAAGSGSLELVEWLWERGCRRWCERTLGAAAAAGNVALLEWLVARGCPMGASGQAYLSAARNGDSATLRCLRRLGCPWDVDLDGGTFLNALGGRGGFAPCSLAVLRWLQAEGCPIDWAAARARVEGRRDAWAAGVLAWIGCQQQAALEAEMAELEAGIVDQ